MPHAFKLKNLETLQGLRIATSYPETLFEFLKIHDIEARVIEISGSVELAPAIKIAVYGTKLAKGGRFDSDGSSRCSIF